MKIEPPPVYRPLRGQIRESIPAKINPIEVVLGPLRRADWSEVESRVDLIAELTGFQPPRNEDPVTWYKNIMGKLGKHYKYSCHNEPGGETCIYTYTTNKASVLYNHPVLSAMRGTVIRWYDNGEAVLLGMPFAKFFNYGTIKEFDKAPRKGFVATEKLDGTLISCWTDTNGATRCNTKGMLDKNNPFVAKFWEVVKRDRLEYELETLLDKHWTVMFELVGPVPASLAQNNILKMLKSDNWHAYFLAVRTRNGDISYNVETAIPRASFVEVKDINEAVDLVMKMKDKEGIVVHYPGSKYRPGEAYWWWDFMLKIKSLAYIAPVIGNSVISPRNLAISILRGSYDDIKPVLGELGVPEERIKFADRVEELRSRLVSTWEELYPAITSRSGDDQLKRLLKPKQIFEEALKTGSIIDGVLVLLPRKQEKIIKYLEGVVKRLEKVKQYVYATNG